MCVTPSCVFLFFVWQLGQKFVEDPRLKVFKKEWFEGKDCLDIGCNSGMVTIQIGSNTSISVFIYIYIYLKKKKKKKGFIRPYHVQ